MDKKHDNPGGEEKKKESICIKIFFAFAFISNIMIAVGSFELYDIEDSYSNAEINAQCDNEIDELTYNLDFKSDMIRLFVGSLLASLGWLFIATLKDLHEEKTNYLVCASVPIVAVCLLWNVVAGGEFFIYSARVQDFCDSDLSYRKDFISVANWFGAIIGLYIFVWFCMIICAFCVICQHTPLCKCKVYDWCCQKFCCFCPNGVVNGYYELMCCCCPHDSNSDNNS